MRKHLPLLGTIALLAHFSELKAQTTPWVYNGNAPAAGTFIGTTNFQPFLFRAGNAPSFQIEGANVPNRGFVGLGDYTTFTPQSRLHLHQTGNVLARVYAQLTTPTSGTTATDGFRLGITPQGPGITPLQFAEINQQEDAPLIFRTGAGVDNAERMRIMGTNNPYGTNLNAGFVGIGGIENPRSMLHLSTVAGNIGGGWRDWMVFGTYMNDNTDNMWVGLRVSETFAAGGDRHDAVINWGDNSTGTNGGSDNMRFIFTGPNTNTTPGDPSSPNGRETMRITPEGRVGIGDFSTWVGGTNTNLPGPTARLDVAAGGVRFRSLGNSTQTNVLVVDANGNVGINSNFTVAPPVTASNGIWINGTSVELGINPLQYNTNIPLNGFNLSLGNLGLAGTNSFLVGKTVSSAPTIPIPANLWFVPVTDAKVQIYQQSGNNRDLGLHVITESLNGIGAVVEGGSIGLHGSASQGTAASTGGTMGADNDHVGVYGEATGRTERRNFGVQGFATGEPTLNINSGNPNFGGAFVASSNVAAMSNSNTGVSGEGRDGATNTGGSFSAVSTTAGTSANYAVRAVAQSTASTGSTTNYGVIASAFSNSNSSVNYGVYASGGVATPNGVLGPSYAGYFSGDLAYTGNFGLASDNALKRQVTTLDSAMAIINQLRPVSYRFKRNQFPQMNLARGKQYGLIAQEVQQVLPAIVFDNLHPAVTDTLGNIIHAEVNYKSINYTELIPYLIKGMQEQQAQIDSLQATLAILTAPTGGTRVSSAQNTTIVELSNKAIVLDQNVPNPFAERTSIRFVLPDTYSSALMLFHDQNGRLVKSVQLTDKGEGHLDVYAQNLTDGVYTYTLVVDGAVIDSKRMVRQK